ncbi:MAG TPA: histidinol-phosphate transaminase [Dehalococcoidia bacterium]|nr:histidinol-phosphate transaminase [Dehalococcoidia bacterium]
MSDDERRSARDLVRPHLNELPGYVPVDPIDFVADELGIEPGDISKLDANENPYGPSPKVAEALGGYGWYHLYPDPAQRTVRRAVADYVGCDAEQVVFGSGSDEILGMAADLFIDPGDGILDAPPTFGVYEFLAHVHDARLITVPRDEDFSLDLPAMEKALDDGAKLAYLASPNNPTGNRVSRDEIKRLLDHDAVLVVDEAYAEFAGESAVDMIAEHDNLIVVRTFSKWAGLAGLRAGYAVVPHSLVEILWRAKVPYNLGVASEQAILASLADRETLMANVRLISEERERMRERLDALGWIRPYPSVTNFILCEVRGQDAKHVRYELRKRGILVRYYNTSGLRNCIRISVGLPRDTDRVIAALSEIGATVG